MEYQIESEAAAKVFLPEAMPRWLVERYHSPEVRDPQEYVLYPSGGHDRWRSTKATIVHSVSELVVAHEPLQRCCFGCV